MAYKFLDSVFMVCKTCYLSIQDKFKVRSDSDQSLSTRALKAM